MRKVKSDRGKLIDELVGPSSAECTQKGLNVAEQNGSIWFGFLASLLSLHYLCSFSVSLNSSLATIFPVCCPAI
jgi:hypothetical protein